MDEQSNREPDKTRVKRRSTKTQKEEILSTTKEKEKRDLSKILPLVLTIGIFLSITVGVVSLALREKSMKKISINTSSIKMSNPVSISKGVGVIELYGVISYEKRNDGIFENSKLSVAEQFVEDFKFMVNNNNVYAIVISIESPGGTLVSCEESLKEIKRLKEKTEKPVIVSFRSIAASGGYYLAMIGDEIFANEATLTGSIGVISQFMNFKEALDKLGIKAYSITSGKNKDSLSPFRAPREDELTYWQGITDEMVLNFISVVETSREGKLKADKNILFDGRVFSGKKALEYGLVDQIGTLNDAIRYASKKAGKDIEEPSIIKNEKQNTNPLTAILNSLSGIGSVKVSYYEDILKQKYIGVPMYLYTPSMLSE